MFLNGSRVEVVDPPTESRRRISTLSSARPSGSRIVVVALLDVLDARRKRTHLAGWTCRSLA
jgi:hypothetical protein